MKYQTDEALREILRRGEQITVRRERRTIRALAGATGALFMALVLAIGFGSHRVSSNRLRSVYPVGLRLVPAEPGGRRLRAGGGDRVRAGRDGHAAVHPPETEHNP